MANDDLYDFAEKRGIYVETCSIPLNKSFSVSFNGEHLIAIDERAMETSAEERTHLAHELGHCETESFYIPGAPISTRGKAEARATRWAVQKLIPKHKMLELLKQGYEKWDLADYFNVTEDFIITAHHLYFEVGISA